MDMETVWVEKKYVRPRLSADEVWLIYRLIDSQYWLLRRHSHRLWKLEKVSRFRRKILRLVNGCRTRKYQISLRERLYWTINCALETEKSLGKKYSGRTTSTSINEATKDSVKESPTNSETQKYFKSASKPCDTGKKLFFVEDVCYCSTTFV